MEKSRHCVTTDLPRLMFQTTAQFAWKIISELIKMHVAIICNERLSLNKRHRNTAQTKASKFMYAPPTLIATRFDFHFLASKIPILKFYIVNWIWFRFMIQELNENYREDCECDVNE